MSTAIIEETITKFRLSKMLLDELKKKQVSVVLKNLYDTYKKDNPYYNRVEKIVKITGWINRDLGEYRQTKGNFDPVLPRPWGKDLTGPVCEHKGAMYLKLIVKAASKPRLLLEGIEVKGKIKKAIVACAKPHESNDFICVKLDNILNIKLNGVVYHIQK